MKRLGCVFAVLVAALVAPRAIGAHHSFAPFDLANPIKIEGTVTKFEYTNPHAYLYVMTTAGEWVVEFGSVSGLRRSGILRTTFKPGDRVTIAGAPRKDGQKEMARPRLFNEAGEEIFKAPLVAAPTQ